jgi:hypothetical protein
VSGTFTKELRLMRGGLRDRVEQLRRMWTRLSPGALLVRGAVFGCAAAALAVAYAPLAPTSGLGAAAVLVLLAGLAALLPRTMVITMVIFAATIGWVLTGAVYGERVSLARLVAEAGLLYLLHTSAALAAIVPYDAVVDPRVLSRWLLRALAVVGLAAVFAVAAAVAAQWAGGRTYLVATLAGLAVVAGLAALLAAARRP